MKGSDAELGLVEKVVSEHKHEVLDVAMDSCGVEDIGQELCRKSVTPSCKSRNVLTTRRSLCPTTCGICLGAGWIGDRRNDGSWTARGSRRSGYGDNRDRRSRKGCCSGLVVLWQLHMSDLNIAKPPHQLTTAFAIRAVDPAMSRTIMATQATTPLRFISMSCCDSGA